MRKILRAEVVWKCSAWISAMTGEGWVLVALLMTSEASSVSEQHRKIHCIAHGVGNGGDSVGAAQNGDCHSDRIAGLVLVKSRAWASVGWGAGIAQLVVLGLAVHSVTGSILLWGHFPVEGIFPLELTWVQTPFPQKLLRMRV